MTTICWQQTKDIFLLDGILHVNFFFYTFFFYTFFFYTFFFLNIFFLKLKNFTFLNPLDQLGHSGHDDICEPTEINDIPKGKFVSFNGNYTALFREWSVKTHRLFPQL